jgi:hypothetical protein
VGPDRFVSDHGAIFYWRLLDTEGVMLKLETKMEDFSHIIKRKEINKFLILYHNKKFGNFIDKTKLTNEQLQFIKSKIKGKK